MRHPPPAGPPIDLKPDNAVLFGLKFNGGKPIACLRNLVYVLTMDRRWADRLSWSEFDSAVVIDRRRLTDRDITAAAVWMDEVYGVRGPLASVARAIQFVSEHRPFHPIRDRLDRLVWDGVPTAEMVLIKYFGASDTPITRKLGRAFLLAAVSRALDPGCPHGAMLVLVGPPGNAAAAACAALVPHPEWFGRVRIDAATRDPGARLAGTWICEITGLEGLRRSLEESTVDLVTTAVDRAGPDGRDRPRHCVLFATTTVDELVGEPAVANHLWPVRVGTADVAGVVRDRDQLLAEAVSWYHAGERSALTGEYPAMLAEAQRAFAAVDAWESPLESWAVGQRTPFTVEAAMEALGLGVGRWTDETRRRVGKVLTRLGYEQTRPRSSQKRRPRRWSPVHDDRCADHPAVLPVQREVAEWTRKHRGTS